MCRLTFHNIIRYTPTYRIFLETGTYNGDTILELHNFFDELHTIEINMEYHINAKRRLSHLNNVKALQGNSKSILPSLCPKLPNGTIFYLDTDESSLAEELRIVMSYYPHSTVILINDINKKNLSIATLSAIIASRVKTLTLYNNIVNIELNPIGGDYWSIPRCLNRVNIHGKEYIVKDNEMRILELPECYPMIIREDVAHLDRLVYVLDKLNLTLLFVGYEYGGYIIDNLKTKSQLYKCSMIDAKILRKAKVVDVLVNTAMIYLSEDVNIDYSYYLVIVTRKRLHISNTKHYSLEGITNFYVRLDYVKRFEERVKVLDDIIVEDNLMQLLIMIKDGGDSFYNMLLHNVPLFDSYIIFDVGSTDNTIANIKNIISMFPYGKLYQKDCKCHRDTRNELLSIAGKEYVFNIMLDDTQYLRGDIRNFLTKVRSDDVAQSFSIYIKDNFSSYISNVITKSRLGLRYKYIVNEIIENNICLKIPETIAYVEEISNNYTIARNICRKKKDLYHQLLDLHDNPFDANIVYNLAETYLALKDYQNAFDMYQSCAKLVDSATKEHIQDCYYKMGTLALWNLTIEFLISRNAMTWKDYYLKSYETIPSRPEALYAIGSYYYNKGEMEDSYYWLKRAYDVNIAMIDRPNMNNRHKIYDHDIYSLLIPLCYHKPNYSLGLDCCIRIVNSDCKDYWTLVFYLLVEYYMIEENKIFDSTICFIVPSGYNYNTIEEKELGRVERGIIGLAESLAKCNNVTVLCNCNMDKYRKGVSYVNIHNSPMFFATNRVTTCYVCGYSEYIPLCVKANVENIYLVYTDLLRDYDRILDAHKIKSVLLLSHWHREYFLSNLPDDYTVPTSIISYGIELSVIREKVKYSFIYANHPNRGLIHLLDIFPRIRMRYPTATLNIFCDLSNMMAEIEKKITQDGVINHGLVSEEVLNNHWATSHVWLYPCIYEETYCRSCLEAAANKVLIVSNNIASLVENNKGIIIQGDITDDWKDRAVEVVSHFFDNESDYSNIINRCYNWANEKSYDNVIRMLP